MAKKLLVVRDHDTGEVVPLSRSERKLLNERLRDMDDPVRYIVVSELIPRNRYFYYVASDNMYAMDMDHASQFKRYEVAQAVCKALDDQRDTRHHLVVKITTKNNNIRPLKYYRDNEST